MGLHREVTYDVAIFVIWGNKTWRALPVEIKRDSQEGRDVGVTGDRRKPPFPRETLIEDDQSDVRESTGVKCKIVPCVF